MVVILPNPGCFSGEWITGFQPDLMQSPTNMLMSHKPLKLNRLGGFDFF